MNLQLKRVRILGTDHICAVLNVNEMTHLSEYSLVTDMVTLRRMNTVHSEVCELLLRSAFEEAKERKLWALAIVSINDSVWLFDSLKSEVFSNAFDVNRISLEQADDIFAKEIKLDIRNSMNAPKYISGAATG